VIGVIELFECLNGCIDSGLNARGIASPVIVLSKVALIISPAWAGVTDASIAATNTIAAAENLYAISPID